MKTLLTLILAFTFGCVGLITSDTKYHPSEFCEDFISAICAVAIACDNFSTQEGCEVYLRYELPACSDWKESNICNEGESFNEGTAELCIEGIYDTTSCSVNLPGSCNFICS